MDLQIFQIPEMSFQTPSRWESFEGEGGPRGRWGWGTEARLSDLGAPLQAQA